MSSNVSILSITTPHDHHDTHNHDDHHNQKEIASVASDDHHHHHHAHSPSIHHGGDHHHHTSHATPSHGAISSSHTTSHHSGGSSSPVDIANAWLQQIHAATSGAHSSGHGDDNSISTRSVLNIKRVCYYFRLWLAFIGVHSPPYRAESYHFAPDERWSCQCPRDHLSCLVGCCHPQSCCDCCRQRHFYDKLPHQQRLSRCDRWCWPTSAVLLVLLLCVGLLFGPALSLFGLNQYEVINENPQFCEFSESILAQYHKILLNLTSLPAGIANATALLTLANSSYNAAAIKYVSMFNGSAWPQPYSPSQEQLAEDKNIWSICDIQECKWGINLWVNCVELSVPCPNTYNMMQNANDLMIADYNSHITPYNQTVNNILNQTSVPSTDLRDQVVGQLFTLYSRIQWGVTLYVFYLGLRIFIGDPYHMAQPSIPSRCLSLLGSATKPTWVILFVMGWYLSEVIMQYLSLPDVKFFWITLRANPCWLDRHFVAQFYALIQNVCDDTYFYQNQFQMAFANYNHFQQVEGSYLLAFSPIPWYRIISPYIIYTTQLNPNVTVYTAKCDPSTLIPLVLGMPHESSLSWMNVLVQSGVFMALFLEPFLAHFLLAVFDFFAPLSTTNGRVLLPMDSLLEVFDKHGEIHADARRRITTFIRASSLLPAIFWCGALVILICTQYQYFQVLPTNTF